MFTHLLFTENLSSFPSLLDLLIKSAILLGIAALVTLACWRASAAQRHLLWTLAVIGLLLLPVLSAVLPSWHVVRLPEWRPTPPRQSTQANTAAPSPVTVATKQAFNQLSAEDNTPGTPSPALGEEIRNTPQAQKTPKPSLEIASSSIWPWYTWLTLVWIIGSALLLARMFYGYAIAWRLIKGATAAPAAWKSDLPTRVQLLISPVIVMPVVLGIKLPTIIFPTQSEEWSAERRRVVLLHELAHLKRRDLLVKLLTQLASTCYWINPLIWYAAYRLRVEREIACDDAVLNADIKAADYADHLLAIASTLQHRQFPRVAGIAMAISSKVGKRIKKVLDGTRNRNNVSRLGMVLLYTFSLLFFVLLAIATQSDKRSQFAQLSSSNEHLRVRVPESVPLNDIVISPDGNHIAFVQQVDAKQTVIVDGKQGPLFDCIKSPWYERNFKNDSIQALPPSEMDAGLYFSPNGKRLAYVAAEWRNNAPINWSKARVALVINGHASKLYNEIRKPVFSANSLHYAYAARKGNRWCIVHDGRENKWHDNVGIPVFSPDGKHLAYSAKTGKRLRLIRDKREENPALFTNGDFLGNIVYSPNSAKLLYLLGREKDASRLVLDGKEQKEFGGVQEALFSPQGQLVLVDSYYQLFVDGNYLDSIYPHELQFVQGDRLTYYAKTNRIGGLMIDHDFSERSQFPKQYAQKHISRVQFVPQAGNIIFSHSGMCWAMVEDVSSIQNTVDSPLTGAKVLFRVTDESMDEQRAFGNHNEGNVFSSINDIRFSLDDNHLVYIADRANQTILVIDGHEEQLDYHVLRTQEQGTSGRQMIFFDAPDRFHYFVVKNGVIERVEVRIPSDTNPASENPTPTFTLSTQHTWQPASASPSGRYIAVSYPRDPGGLGIWVGDLKTDTWRKIWDRVGEIQWLPDERGMIVMIGGKRERAEGRASPHCTFYRVPLTGTVVQLTEPTDICDWMLLSDGSGLVATRVIDKRKQDGLTEERIETGIYSFAQHKWMPKYTAPFMWFDGPGGTCLAVRKHQDAWVISYVEGRTGDSSERWVNLTTGEDMKVHGDGYRQYYSPDGQYAIVGTRLFRSRTWPVPPAGRDWGGNALMNLIHTFPRPFVNSYWAPDSRNIAYDGISVFSMDGTNVFNHDGVFDIWVGGTSLLIFQGHREVLYPIDGGAGREVFRVVYQDTPAKKTQPATSPPVTKN